MVKSKEDTQKHPLPRSPGGTCVAAWDTFDESTPVRKPRTPIVGTSYLPANQRKEGDDHRYQFSVNSVDWGQ